jgi:hypothetical protein
MAGGLMALTTTLLLLGLLPNEQSAQAADSPRYAQAAGEVFCVTLEGGSLYSGCTQVFTNVQAAVDAATGGEIIKVATGVYTGVGPFSQLVYVPRTLIIRGGYTTTFTDPPDPVANPTTLDAQGQGTVLVIGMNISPTIEGLHITGGNGFSGGGVFIDIAARPVISGCQIYSNTASSGGGIYVSNEAAPTIRKCQIFSNAAQSGGGVSLYAVWDATLESNLIRGNVATDTLAASGGGGVKMSGYATLNGNTIISNSAQSTGGGLQVFGDSEVVLSGNTVMSNTATTGGGLWMATYTRYDISAVLSGNLFMHNTAGTGGAMYLYRSDAWLTNNVIADNHVITSGSGLYLSGSPFLLRHNTIARNSGGNGSGIYVTDQLGYFGRVILTNTILVSQTVGITATAGNTVTANSILWFGNGTNRGGGGFFSLANEFTGNPAFAADGYHLTGRSAAINAGVDAGVTIDIDGDPRPLAGGYDIGADEYNYPYHLYLPVVLRQ